MSIERPTRRAPGPQGHPVIGSLAELRADPIRLFADALHDHGDVVRLRLVQDVHLVNHPEHFRHVLQDRHRNYAKGFGYDRMEPLIGKSLLNGEGEWCGRSYAQPASHRQRVSEFAQLMVRHTARLIERWEELPPQFTIDVHAEMTQLAFAIVVDALFSVDMRRDARTTGQAFREALAAIDEHFPSSMGTPSWLPSSQDRRLRTAVAAVDRLVGGLVAERRRSGVQRNDLLGMLLAVRDERTGAPMDPGQLREELTTMVLAGHETTANTLSWLWYLLSRHADAESRLHGELAATLQGRTPTLDDLPSLQRTTMTVEETLRLYPPVWLFGRRAIAEDTIGGYRIPAGSTLFLSPYLAHRDPRFWPEPDRFDPERFHPDAIAARSPLSYFPFAFGPRRCMGSAFAMMALQIVVAMVASRFSLRLAAGETVEPEPGITLRPRNGLLMTLQRRQAAGPAAANDAPTEPLEEALA